MGSDDDADDEDAKTNDNKCDNNDVNQQDGTAKMISLGGHVVGLGGPHQVPAHPILKIGAPKIAQAALHRVLMKLFPQLNPAH